MTPDASGSKSALLKTLEFERAELEALIDRVPLERQDMPGVIGDWSVKDLIAQFLLWEQWVLDRCSQLMKVRQVIANERDTRCTNEMNRLHFERYRPLPLDQVRNEERRVFAALIDLIQAFDEDALFASGRYEFASGGALADEIANETVRHYQVHRETLTSFAHGFVK